MSKIFNITSHELTNAQMDDIKKALNVTTKKDMPQKLKKIWGNIPPDYENVYPVLEPIIKWIAANAQENDYIMVQGDYGATYIVVNHCFDHNFFPCYITTKRTASENTLDDGTVEIIKKFKHARVRLYEKY